ncbi:MAG: hypothetical protein KDD67_09660 [Ignavibacteriae bacterium]|nr:hypothetical protein [Ignavibacteriota bacterium]
MAVGKAAVFRGQSPRLHSGIPFGADGAVNILRCRTDVEFLSAWIFTIFTQEASNYRSAPEGRIVAWPWGKPQAAPQGNVVYTINLPP